MPDEVEVVVHPIEDSRIGDRSLDEFDTVIDRDVLALGREQVVDDDQLANLLRQQPTDEVGADEAGSTDDQDTALDAYAFSPTGFRWVYVCSMPYVL
jgi:hypothetical protein